MKLFGSSSFGTTFRGERIFEYVKFMVNINVLCNISVLETTNTY